MKAIFSLFIFSFLVSCSSNSDNHVVRKEHVNVEENSSENVVANRKLIMEVNGMTCVMGCGSSIRKDLYNTKGVSEVEFDFEEDRKTNLAKIKFDKNIVSVEEMVSIVNAMNENQFTVGKTETENINIKNSEEEVIHTHSSDKDENEEIIKTSSSSFGVTGFIALLTNFLTKNSSNFKTVTLD